MLQVHDIGPQVTAFENTYDFHIGHEFFGRIRKDQADNNIGSTLEKATFSVIQENKTDQFILCIGNEKGGSASLLFISKKNCTSLIHTVETHVACQLMVEHLY